jgi:hypothetical protein
LRLGLRLLLWGEQPGGPATTTIAHQSRNGSGTYPLGVPADHFVLGHNGVVFGVPRKFGGAYPELFDADHTLRIFIEGPIDSLGAKINLIHFEVKLYDARSEKYLNPQVDSRTGKRVPVPENTMRAETDDPQIKKNADETIAQLLKRPKDLLESRCIPMHKPDPVFVPRP